MKEKTLKKNSVFKGRVFEVFVADIILPDGNRSIREVVAHNGGVCIYAEIDGEILMVRQYRYALQQEVLELPAGKLELEEDPQEAAGRELLEETGYQAGKLISLGCFFPSCGYTSEIIHLFKAEELTFKGQQLDPTEFLQVERIKIADLRWMIDNNEIVDSKTLVALLKVGW